MRAFHTVSQNAVLQIECAVLAFYLYTQCMLLRRSLTCIFFVCFFQQVMVVFEFKGSKLKVLQRLPVTSGLLEIGMLYADD